MNAKLAQGSQPDKRAIGVLVAIVMAAGTLTGCSSAVLPSAVGGAHGRPAAGSVTLREAELDPPVLVDGVTLSLVSDSGGTGVEDDAGEKRVAAAVDQALHVGGLGL